MVLRMRTGSAGCSAWCLDEQLLVYGGGRHRQRPDPAAHRSSSTKPISRPLSSASSRSSGTRPFHAGKAIEIVARQKSVSDWKSASPRSGAGAKFADPGFEHLVSPGAGHPGHVLLPGVPPPGNCAREAPRRARARWLDAFLVSGERLGHTSRRARGRRRPGRSRTPHCHAVSRECAPATCPDSMTGIGIAGVTHVDDDAYEGRAASRFLDALHQREEDPEVLRVARSRRRQIARSVLPALHRARPPSPPNRRRWREDRMPHDAARALRIAFSMKVSPLSSTGSISNADWASTSQPRGASKRENLTQLAGIGAGENDASRGAPSGCGRHVSAPRG